MIEEQIPAFPDGTSREQIPTSSNNTSRRTALRTLVLGVAGMVSGGLAAGKEETKLSPIPQISSKEEALTYLEKILRPALREELINLSNEKQWSYATTEQSFRDDIATATESLPALSQLEELVTLGWITRKLVYGKTPEQSEHGIDIRVKGVENNNGFYWFCRSINTDKGGSL